MTPGEDTRQTVYLFTQPSCANCPAAKMVLSEALQGTNIQLKTVDLQSMDPDLEFRLLEEQVFIASTPSVIVEDGHGLRLLYSGQVPSVEDVRQKLGVGTL
jgi:glutaredoxin